MTYRSTAMLVVANVALIVAALWPLRVPSVVADQPALGVPAGWSAAAFDPDTVGDSVGTSQLQRIALSRNGLGLVVGTRGRTWRSSASGSTWVAGTIPAAMLPAAALNDEGVGVLSAGNGRIFRSVDTGATWTMVRPPTLQKPVQDFEWDNDSTVFAVGRQQILVSRNAGVGWEELNVPVRDYQSLAKHGRLMVAVGGGGTILRSTDSGVGWVLQQGGTKALLRGVAFADEATVVAVGSSGTIIRSVDQGEHWQDVPSGTEAHLRAVAFDATGRGLAVGFFGTLLESVDRGASWQAMASGTRAHLLDVAFDPDGRPLIAGYFDILLRGQPTPVMATP